MILNPSTVTIVAIHIICSTCEVEVGVVPGTEAQNFTDGVFYDYDHDVVLFVSKDLYELHRLDPVTGRDQSITLDGVPTFIIPTKDSNDRFIINKGADLIYLFWPSEYDNGYYAECLVAAVDPYCPGNTLNDIKVDAVGTIWTSTYPPSDSNGVYALNRGTLYNVDARWPGKAKVKTVLSPLAFPNDLTWTSDNNMFYMVESASGCVFSYHFDLLNGEICNRETIFCFADYNITGRPSGLVTDWNDDLWLTSEGAGLVLNVNPNTRQLVRTVAFPVKVLTDLAFGGPKRDVLFVSSQDVGDPEEPLAGAIFQVTGLDVLGLFNNDVVIGSDCTPEFFN